MFESRHALINSRNLLGCTESAYTPERKQQEKVQQNTTSIEKGSFVIN